MHLFFTAQEHQQEHGYIPLSEVAVYASTLPEGTNVPGHRQLVLVHNQTFCVTFGNNPQRVNASQTHPPSYEESQQNDIGTSSVSHSYLFILQLCSHDTSTCKQR